MTTRRASLSPRLRATAWLERWGPLLPLLVAEFVVWLGFGGLLPVLPLYFTEQGIDLATLGIVIAAWPAARLLTEPVFGWLADRWPRVPLMVLGLVVYGLAGALPLVWTGALPFTLLRAASGVGAALYDPAARGFLTDATPPARRGEAFGLYAAAQMGGLLLGPTIGAFGAARFGGIGFVFVFSAVTAILAAVLIAVRLREDVYEQRPHATPPLGRTEFPPDAPFLEERWAADRAIDEARHAAPAPTGPGAEALADAAARRDRRMRLLNRGLLAALILNLGGYVGSGTYQVVWSLFLEGLGADLTLIGLTFALFGLPVLLISPFAGRMVDRRGPLPFIVAGMILPAVVALLYTQLREPVLALPLILVEAVGFALLNPALYAVVAANAPPGRSSTAQGLFGAAGTLGFILASLAAGVLAGWSIVLPFVLCSAVMGITLVIGLGLGGGRLREGRRDDVRAPGSGASTFDGAGLGPGATDRDERAI